MLSPSVSFFDTVFEFTPSARNHDRDVGGGARTADASVGVLRCGVIGTAASIPVGWRYQVLVCFDAFRLFVCLFARVSVKTGGVLASPLVCLISMRFKKLHCDTELLDEFATLLRSRRKHRTEQTGVSSTHLAPI